MWDLRWETEKRESVCAIIVRTKYSCVACANSGLGKRDKESKKTLKTRENLTRDKILFFNSKIIEVYDKTK